MTTNDELIALASHADNARAMIAFRDLTRYLTECADHEISLITAYPNAFRIAFLDDDSDYIPAAMRLLTALADALTADDCETQTTALMHRLATESDDDSHAADALDYYPPTLPPMPELDYMTES